jgi:hypothetical protein
MQNGNGVAFGPEKLLHEMLEFIAPEVEELGSQA